MIDKITKIQNGAKSLMWGCSRLSETETLFVVGHKSYPRENKFFVVADNLAIGIVTDDHKLEYYTICENEKEVLKVIYDLLKKWFPAKGGN